jgi:hypothetical protein
MKAARGPILILHDSSDFTYQRGSAAGMGLITRPRLPTGSGKGSKLRRLTVRGLLMPSSRALTLEGLPLGLCAVKFWTRRQWLEGC